MVLEKDVRSLLAPADPARGVNVAPPRLSAHEVIARAESNAGRPVGVRHARATRRLVLAAGATTGVAVLGGAAGIVYGSRKLAGDKATSTAGWAAVLAPVAYQYQSDPAPAGPYLRQLADRLVDAPYDVHSGRYAYHHTRTWGDPVETSPDGRYVLGFADETRTWELSDGSGLQTTIQLPAQYPDRASAEYWRRRMKGLDSTSAPQTTPLPPFPRDPLPTDPARLTSALVGRVGPYKSLDNVYGVYIVPRAARATILRVLAQTPTVAWRGAVTDRAGRQGLAATVAMASLELLYVFHPQTGELLAMELVDRDNREVNLYRLFLQTDRTDRAG